MKQTGWEPKRFGPFLWPGTKTAIICILGLLFLFFALPVKAEYWVDFKRVNGKEAVVVEYDTGLTKIYFVNEETWKTLDADKISKEVCNGLQLKNCNRN